MSDLERDGLDLWRRYRAAAWPPSGSIDPAGSMPEIGPEMVPEMAPGLLAAYLEHRLDEVEAAPVENWLARNPDAIVLLAEINPSENSPPAPLALIRQARGLVGTPARPTWRHAVAWASIAASLVIVGTTGFMAGHDTVDRNEAIATVVSGDLVDGPGGGDDDGAAF
jgi:hypothetical protein